MSKTNWYQYELVSVRVDLIPSWRQFQLVSVRVGVGSSWCRFDLASVLVRVSGRYLGLAIQVSERHFDKLSGNAYCIVFKCV